MRSDIYLQYKNIFKETHSNFNNRLPIEIRFVDLSKYTVLILGLTSASAASPRPSDA
jgi:hypothetical protein